MKENKVVNNSPKFKVCSKCKTSKPYSEYYPNANDKNKLRSICKSCHVEVVNNNRKIREYGIPNGTEKIIVDGKVLGFRVPKNKKNKFKY